MKSPARCAALLLPFLLTGCFQLPFHKNRPAQNHPLAPPVEPEPAQPLELAFVELPPALTVIPGKPIYNMREQVQPIRQAVRRRRPPAANPEDTASTTDVPANPGAGVSALGELSSGDPANIRRQTENSIAAIERGLNGINRNLSEPDQKTAAHVREFVKQAKAALASGDVEGAHTLTVKAQVLLAELTH
jgi:hypothetical protein